MDYRLGSLVAYRGRPWILADREGDLLYLRPLGAEDLLPVRLDLVAALREVLPHEDLSPASFPPPKATPLASPQEFRLFLQGARLLLRDGTAPLRSLGRVGVRPRTYQLVPLLMALKLHPVRLLIADDVGVGKTVEAGLVARELLDRKLARRLAVLAPPHLLDQWAEELRDKFALEAVVVSAGSLARLERSLSPGENLYRHFPVVVASIDFVKHERHRALFLEGAPELVIVDEAHGAVGGPSEALQKRYELVRALAEDPNRHLLLLTATPHSGLPEAFSRLLGLLSPEFATWDLARLDEEKRARLARHFVQRTRKDIAAAWEGASLFPEREVRYETYLLSPEYRALYEATYRYAREVVRQSEGLAEGRRRMRWWAALTLLRTVMSSPQSARAALERRGIPLEDEEALLDLAPQVYESSETTPTDEVPEALVDLAEREASGVVEGAGRKRLSGLKRLVEALTPEKDTKLQGLLSLLSGLLREGHHPVVWCHFVDTAEYVGEAVRKAFPEAHVAVVTGRMDGEARREAVEALMEETPRVLVATDCVSEGVNLQRGFTAVVHYDLPWNPNRLEQREGRVDRYGQRARRVVAVRYRGKDNPVDEKVVEVLLRKAEEIRKALGVHVPVPEEERYVVDRMVRSLFYEGEQPLLFAESDLLEERWGRDVERERESRSRFAQRALRPEEALRALEGTDAVLGSPEEVRDFVLLAAKVVGLEVREKDGGYEFRPSPTLPEPLLAPFRDAKGKERPLFLAFQDPPPEGASFAGRTHPLVVALARHFLEGALRGERGRYAVRRVAGIGRAHYLYLLRPRFLLRSREGEVVGEEVLLLALGPEGLLKGEQARELLSLEAKGNVSSEEAREFFTLALKRYEEGGGEVEAYLAERAREIREAHRALRRAARERVGDLEVEPVPPPDLLGVLVLIPAR
ncbi:helicase-related protein (plasmid) [Thermus thermophilus]|uniref:Helicase n=1 Tax=Thermus thermophilus TaxID=274 RepID=A0AAD1KXI6_THETH|nr:helicase-related protein [Thermus thermophilus]BCZ88066.1 helicase [Thermus thermophilus]